MWIRNAVSKDTYSGYENDRFGWNFLNDNSDVRDELGHGTQVAGIIAGAIAGKKNIRILPIKALDRSGTGRVSEIVEAIDYALIRRAAVINCSFGTPSYSRALLEAVNRAEIVGTVVVAAAGNQSSHIAVSPFYPASYQLDKARNLISVAAANEKGMLAGFSNYSVHIAAAGENLLTAHPGRQYVRMTGTSAAAGIVAAAAAGLKNLRAWVSATTIRDTLIKGAIKQ
ncbi:MAG: S8 family serine peptidase [Blastocatellales bacterium]